MTYLILSIAFNIIAGAYLVFAMALSFTDMSRIIIFAFYIIALIWAVLGQHYYDRYKLDKLFDEENKE